MSKKYSALIRKLREDRNIPQSDVATKLGISRPSYIAIEQGKRELSLSEAEKLSEIFGVSLKEMQEGTVSNYAKYKQMILAYIRHAGSKKDGRIPKTKLAKLVYLADFAWFYKHLESMSGMPYRKIHYGPVPDSYFRAIDELFEEGQIDVTPTLDGAMLVSKTRTGSKAALSEINKEEEKLIKDISEKWKGKSTKEIVAFTHRQLPYSVCSENEIIPYELITQENPEDVY